MFYILLILTLVPDFFTLRIHKIIAALPYNVIVRVLKDITNTNSLLVLPNWEKNKPKTKTQNQTNIKHTQKKETQKPHPNTKSRPSRSKLMKPVGVAILFLKYLDILWSKFQSFLCSLK